MSNKVQRSWLTAPELKYLAMFKCFVEFVKDGEVFDEDNEIKKYDHARYLVDVFK